MRKINSIKLICVGLASMCLLSCKHSEAEYLHHFKVLSQEICSTKGFLISHQIIDNFSEWWIETDTGDDLIILENRGADSDLMVLAKTYSSDRNFFNADEIIDSSKFSGNEEIYLPTDGIVYVLETFKVKLFGQVIDVFRLYMEKKNSNLVLILYDNDLDVQSEIDENHELIKSIFQDDDICNVQNQSASAK